MATATRLGRWTFFGVIGVIAVGFLGALAFPYLRRGDWPSGREFAERPAGETLHPVSIRTPEAKPFVDSGKKDAHGNPVMVSCSTCHDTRTPDFTTNHADQLNEFHQGLKFAHGGQSCLSCHNSGDYNTLKRSDGQPLDFSQSLQLCAQCHGPQYRDYRNGSHGGMTGYWDLKQGPRERNHCTDCHDPHQPHYPLVQPVFPPKPIIGEGKQSPHGESTH